MQVKLENVQITSYQIGVLDTGTDSKDSFVFAPQTPPTGDGDVDGRDFLMWQRGTASGEPAAGDPNLLLPAVTDPSLLLPYTDFYIA